MKHHSIFDLVDAAAVLAGTGRGWNVRFRLAVIAGGMQLVEYDGRMLTDEQVMAPPPMPGDIMPWPPSYIEKCK